MVFLGNGFKRLIGVCFWWAGVPEWPKGRDSRSCSSGFRGFESLPPHLSYSLKFSASPTIIYSIYMPVVTIETWKGKSVEQKAQLMEGIKKAFVDIGVDPTGLTIIIHDIRRYNWAKGGEQVSSEE